MGGKLHAPAVEGEVGYHRTAVGEEGNASVVARPCIVRGQLEAVEPVVQLGRQQAEHPLAIGANDYQPLAVAMRTKQVSTSSSIYAQSVRS